MGTLARLARLPAGERGLLVEAAWLLLLLRATLTVLPLPALETLVGRLARGRRRGAAARVPWAVAATARRLPGASCLVQALAAQVMLRRRGVDAVVRVGVARRPGGPLESHAWVEHEGRVVVGGSDRDRFVPITTWGAT